MSDPKAGVLRNPNLVHQPAHEAFYLASLNLTAGLGIADLNTVTSFYDQSVALTIDWSPEDPDSRDDATAMPYDLEQTMFSQEVRLTSVDPDAPLAWTAGVFYSKERKRESTRLVLATGVVDEEKITAIDQTALEAFGQLGLRIGQRLTASAGVRVGRSSYHGVTETPPISSAGASDTSVVPRFDLTYRTDSDDLFYLTVAKGYRSGDISPPVVTCGDAPTVIPADTLWSYEVGAKANFLGERMHVESSVFHMEWRNEQPDVLFGDEGCSVGALRGAAASDGIDVLAQALVTEHLKVGLAVAYTHAYYTQTIKADGEVIVRDGDALGTPPQVPSPWNVTARVDYQFPLAREITVELGAEDSFHGRNPGPFASDNPGSLVYTPGFEPDPSTNVLNLRAKVSWPSFDLTVFANNVLDSQPTLGVRPGCGCGTVQFGRTLRPRTIGLAASWRF
jgi:outer membrane receptor protein involved in Fe transport